MPSYGYHNGNILPIDEIKIPLTDRSIFFGDSIYEVMVGCYGGIHLFERHLNRLSANLKAIGIHLPVTIQRLIDIITELINISSFHQYIIYLQCSAVGAYRRHSRFNTTSNLIITINEHIVPPLSDTLKLTVMPDIRYELCNLKTTNLLPSVIASTKADKLGCDEAILHRGGVVTECAHSNIFLLKDGVLYTHQESSHILPGIIRSRIIELAPSIGLSVKETPFTLNELPGCDELIISSTTRLIGRAKSVDNLQLNRLSEDFVKNLYKILYTEFTNCPPLSS